MDAVAGGTGAECSLDDGRRALQVVLAAAASADSGLPVVVADAPRSLATRPAAS